MFEKIKTAVLILSSLVGAGVAWGTLSSRIGSIEAAHVELKPRVKAVEDKTAAHDTGIAVMHEKLDNIKAGLDRLEDKMGTNR